MCEYGGNAKGFCTTLADCASNGSPPFRWYVTPPGPECGQTAPGCPAAFGMGEGAACPNVSFPCDYAQGRCDCLSCSTDAGQPSKYWHCRSWDDVDPACPKPRPLIGSECAGLEGTACDYASCCRGPTLAPTIWCKAGTWTYMVSCVGSCVTTFCP
jgi:hypothetical protein